MRTSIQSQIFSSTITWKQIVYSRYYTTANQSNLTAMSSKRDTFAENYAERMKPKKSDSQQEREKRGREMSEDPMLEYFRQKEREKQKASGTRPIYKGNYPHNRYNIRPGHRWDGVDRSNGFEKKLLDKESQKKRREESSYREATRDM